MQILYTKNGKTYDMGTREGRREILGEIQCKPMLVYDEQGELVNFYSSPADMNKNAQLIKSIKEKYPNVSLRKAVDLYQEELMLKVQQEKSDLLKSQQVKPITQKSQKQAKPEMVSEYLQRCLDKLESLSHSRL